MNFKPSLWYPIAWAATVINLVSVGFAAAAAEPWHAGAHAALTLGFGLWTARLRQRKAEGSGSDAGAAREQLEQQAAALEEIRSTLALQSTELAELQERVDFTERLLAQVRDRPGLGGLGAREEHR